MYELILFNIIQNSIKYIKSVDGGDIIILLTCRPLESNDSNNNERNTEGEEQC